jgi:hypothetical protein
LQDGKQVFAKPKAWAVYANMVVDELLMAWEKGIEIDDASSETAARVFVKCIFATFDYPGNKTYLSIHSR